MRFKHGSFSIGLSSGPASAVNYILRSFQRTCYTTNSSQLLRFAFSLLHSICCSFDPNELATFYARILFSLIGSPINFPFFVTESLLFSSICYIDFHFKLNSHVSDTTTRYSDRWPEFRYEDVDRSKLNLFEINVGGYKIPQSIVVPVP